MKLWTDDGRTDDGRRTTEPAYTISSPGAFGSGELKTKLLQFSSKKEIENLTLSVKDCFLISHMNTKSGIFTCGFATHENTAFVVHLVK